MSQFTNRQNTHNFAERICFAEHWKLVADASEFHFTVDLTLRRAHRAILFQLELRKKKRDILSEKRESGMALKKREFTPESGSVDTYAIATIFLERPPLGSHLRSYTIVERTSVK